MRGARSSRIPRVNGAGSSPRMRGAPSKRSPPRHNRPVHPRACGEHQRSCVKRSHLGFIPAHAGSTCAGAMSFRRAGSSPRMRGAPTALHPRAWGCLPVRSNVRFIPAHAGSTPSKTKFVRRIRFIPAHAGSTRNRPACSCSAGSTERFIPAHAGSTRERDRKEGAGSVHPRACGEHDKRRVAREVEIGSSPRMRGAQGGGVGSRFHSRFIPAHAGSTPKLPVVCDSEPVHPRACGEHDVSPSIPLNQPGSSPRMRGAHYAVCRLFWRYILARFIPAHAGSTFPALSPGYHPPVHPRACGEH